MTIQGRVMAAAAMMGGLLVAGGAVGAYSVGSVQSNMDAIQRTEAAALEFLDREVDHLLWVERVSVLATDPTATGLGVALDPTECEFGQWLSGPGGAAAASLDADVEKLLEAAVRPHERMHRGARELDGLMAAGTATPEEIRHRFRMDIVAPATEVQGLLEQGAGRLRKLSDATLAAQETYRRRALTIVVLGVLAGILVVLVGGHFFARSLTVPLRQVVGMIRELGQGRLSRRLELRRRDEIGDLAGAMDRFADTLQTGVVGMLDRLSRGEIDMTIPDAAEGDEITPALHRIRDSLAALVEEMGRLGEAGRSGNLGVRAETGRLEGTYRELAESVNGVLDAIAEPIGEAGRVLDAAAEGDLTTRMRGRYAGDYDRIRTSLNAALSSIGRTLSEVVSAADRVAGKARDIDDASGTLASGAGTQAASLQQISASLQQLVTMADRNESGAREASEVAEEAGRSTTAAREALRRLSEAMARIEESSASTVGVVRTIDEIAFQTNLLALNAAVEAARAGAAGSGFAVVAEEVRNLAIRSAEAARETADLIDESVERARDGAKLEQAVAAELSESDSRMERVREVMSEIVAASGQQTSGVAEIDRAVENMGEATQGTAAAAEQAAGAATELTGEADVVRSLVGRFHVERGRDSRDPGGRDPRADKGGARTSDRSREPVPARA